MKLKNKKSGFTLLEIIIVIIIVGVLASLALPRFFNTVEYSRVTEALNSLGVSRDAIERCALFGSDYAPCDDFLNLDIGDPGDEAGAHFTYGLVMDAVPGDMTLTATRNALDGGNVGDTVILKVLAPNITRSGTGAFLALQ